MIDTKYNKLIIATWLFYSYIFINIYIGIRYYRKIFIIVLEITYTINLHTINYIYKIKVSYSKSKFKFQINRSSVPFEENSAYLKIDEILFFCVIIFNSKYFSPKLDIENVISLET